MQGLTPYFEEKLDELVAKHDCAETRRGKGFMQGIVIKGRPVGDVVKKALAKGLLVISAGWLGGKAEFPCGLPGRL